MKSEHIVLAGDIGGTNAKLGLGRYDGAQVTLLGRHVYPSRRYASLEAVIDAFLNEQDVEELLTMQECIAVMEDALAALARGEVHNPLRQAIRAPGANGLLGLMPASVGRGFSPPPPGEGGLKPRPTLSPENAVPVRPSGSRRERSR